MYNNFIINIPGIEDGSKVVDIVDFAIFVVGAVVTALVVVTTVVVVVVVTAIVDVSAVTAIEVEGIVFTTIVAVSVVAAAGSGKKFSKHSFEECIVQF